MARDRIEVPQAGVMQTGGAPISAMRDQPASAVLTASHDAASAVDESKAVPELPKKEVWRVTKSCEVVMQGVKQKLYEGKEIDTLNYNLTLLRKQGVKLERVTDEE